MCREGPYLQRNPQSQQRFWGGRHHCPIFQMGPLRLREVEPVTVKITHVEPGEGQAGIQVFGSRVHVLPFPLPRGLQVSKN